MLKETCVVSGAGPGLLCQCQQMFSCSHDPIRVCFLSNRLVTTLVCQDALSCSCCRNNFASAAQKKMWLAEGDTGSVFSYECKSDGINGHVGINILSTCSQFLT